MSIWKRKEWNLENGTNLIWTLKMSKIQGINKLKAVKMFIWNFNMQSNHFRYTCIQKMSKMEIKTAEIKYFQKQEIPK